MKRICLDCGRAFDRLQRGRCHDCYLVQQRQRNARPERSIYGGDWPAESRAIRADQPWCSVCYATSDLTVDHPTRAVLCRSHHAALENARRRQKVPA